MFEDQIKAGMALLDQKKPGWRQSIVPDRLEMRRPCGCILAHVFAHYYHGLDALFGPEDNQPVDVRMDYHAKLAAQHGFTVLHSFARAKHRSIDGLFYELKLEWLQALGLTPT